MSGVINALSNSIVRHAENAAVADSSNKLLEEFSNNTNADAIISITVQRRRIGTQSTSGRNVFDEERYDLGFKHGQQLSKINYLGFERILVNSITIMPGTDIIIKNQNRFLKETFLHNGTEITQEKQWIMLKPLAFDIMCVKTNNMDGVFNVSDPKFLDGRLWSSILIIAVIIFVVSIIIYAFATGNVKLNTPTNSVV